MSPIPRMSRTPEPPANLPDMGAYLRRAQMRAPGWHPDNTWMSWVTYHAAATTCWASREAQV